uniref:Uncharacterized protein n=1 Tax=Arundo donax TaxID=35708 RepID=A0A0A9AIX3_ARUDO
MQIDKPDEIYNFSIDTFFIGGRLDVQISKLLFSHHFGHLELPWINSFHHGSSMRVPNHL